MCQFFGPPDINCFGRLADLLCEIIKMEQIFTAYAKNWWFARTVGGWQWYEVANDNIVRNLLSIYITPYKTQYDRLSVTMFFPSNLAYACILGPHSWHSGSFKIALKSSSNGRRVSVSFNFYLTHGPCAFIYNV